MTDPTEPTERRSPAARLGESFFDRPSLDVASDLLGCVVRHAGVAVRLTEVEAYSGELDPGSHAFRGRTPRTDVMFGRPGGLYVYFTYGMHFCANLVCGPDGFASAVLLRSGEVVEGVEVARKRRVVAKDDRDLARGPARLAQALDLRRSENGILTWAADSPMQVLGRVGGNAAAEAEERTAGIRTGPRVGVSGPGGDGDAFPWRFWLDGDRYVSAYRPATKRVRRDRGDAAR